MKKLCCCLLMLILIAASQTASAWDSVGHRLATSIALSLLGDEKKAQLLNILRQHPRFQQDFIDAMPSTLAQADDANRLQWLLGQASYWPDLARRLSAQEREKFNRPPWHFIDGAWLRDAAQTQGNVYLGIDSFAAINGEPAAAIRSPAQIHNVMTALDFNTRLLANSETSPPIRAVALCWVLHLMADIHQPLHAGSLYSEKLFPQGDRGGNGIATDDGNLHARWDRALTGEGLAFHLQAFLQTPSVNRSSTISPEKSDWSLWLNESREILHRQVYSRAIRREITAAQIQDRRMNSIPLDSAYVQQMQSSATRRIQLAGLRLANWFTNEMP